MEKNEKEKEWKTISKKFQESNTKVSDDDINNLNEDNSFSPVDEVEEKVPLTEEEKKAIRKKLFILLIVIIVVIIGLIAVRIIEPYNNKEKDNEEKEQLEENDKENQLTEESIPISDLEDGSILSTNYELINLINEVSYSIKENYVYDTLELFNNNDTNINTLTNRQKLLLVSKTKEFSQLIDSKISSSSLCDNDITIEFSDINKILKNRLNANVTTYEQFVYTHYFEEEFVSYVVFTKKENSYVGTCSGTTNKLVELVQQQFVSARKNENKIYIDMKVVFIKESGVYKDSNFTSLITNDKQTTEDEYFKEANTYRYTYDIIDKNYVLTNVSLVK